MALGIVPGSEVSTPSSGVQMDSSAFRNAALAPGKVAQAIGTDVGGLFQDVSDKVQANRNARTVFQADLAMRKTKDDFTANLAKMPDETTWLPAYKQTVDQTRQKIMDGPNVGPDVKRVLNQKFDIWEAATTSEIRTAALLKGAKETREDAIADATYAAHQGDLEGASNIMKAAVAHYAMTPAESHKLSIKFPQMAAQAQADTAINTNPVNSPELIKRFEGTIEPRMFVGIQAKAREARNAEQTLNANNWGERMDDSPDGTIDPQALHADVQAGKVTEHAERTLLGRMKKEHAEKDKDRFNLLMGAIDDHPWVGDKTPKDSAREFTDEMQGITDSGLRLRAKAHLEKLQKEAEKEGKTEEKPVESDIKEFGKKAFADGLFRPPTSQPIMEDIPNGWLEFGKPNQKQTGTEEVPASADSGWMAGADQKTIGAARLNYTRWQDKMREYFKANPEATSEDAEKYSQKLMAPHVEAQVKAAIIPMSAADAEAKVWAMAHPDDPRAKKIMERLGP